MELLLLAPVGLGNIPMLLVYLLIICIVIGVVYWLITSFLPEPFRKWAIAIMIVIGAILVIQLLMGLAL